MRRVVRLPINGINAAQAVSKTVWNADADYQLLGVTARFKVTSTSGTLMLEHAPSGTVVGSGNNMLAAVMSLAGTAEVPVNGVLAALVSATATLTSDGVAFADAEIVTIGTKAYQFLAIPLVEGDVNRGANAAAALDNLQSAVNHTGTPGTDYICALPHPDVIATTNAATTQLFVAKIPGTGGNALASTETCAHAAFASTVFLGGLGRNSIIIPRSSALNFLFAGTLTNLVELAVSVKLRRLTGLE